MGGPLEGDVVVHVSEPLRRERALGQWQVGDDEQIQDVVAVHEHDLRPLSRVEPLQSEQREQHLFDQFILGAFVEVGKQLFSTLKL